MRKRPIWFSATYMPVKRRRRWTHGKVKQEIKALLQ